MEQAPSRGHGPSPQSGLGLSCKWCSSSKKLRVLGVRAQERRMGTISFLQGFHVPVSPALRDEARRVEVQCRVSVTGALCLSAEIS